MKPRRYAFASLLFIVPLVALATAADSGEKLDAGKIGEAAATKATTTPDGVVRIA